MQGVYKTPVSLPRHTTKRLQRCTVKQWHLELDSVSQQSVGYYRRPISTSIRRQIWLQCAQSDQQSSQSDSSADSLGELSSQENEVLDQLRKTIDPDFDMNIVDCGFIKLCKVENENVEVTIELTTPACPIKEEFERMANENIRSLAWVKDVTLNMTAQAPRPQQFDDRAFNGLRQVKHIIAVSSCKGGVGKSTVAVNLAFSLAQMGARVGLFDADVYGPSLPTMVSPENRSLDIHPESRDITPVMYQGVKCVSVGFAGVQAAIMRGPMASGLIQQLMTTSQWGELDYLVVDFPPGTGDIQLTLCQLAPFSAAVIVTTPQKLAFIDVAKGIRMFAKLMVPCVACVENMSYYEIEGKKHYPFGQGSGERIMNEFGLPHLFKVPIDADLSQAGDGGTPVVVSTPTSEVSQTFQQVGVAMVREVAKLSAVAPTVVEFNEEYQYITVKVKALNLDFNCHPATVRRADTSASSINEWTGEKLLDPASIANDIMPEKINKLGNYAVQIDWKDGFNQVMPFEVLLDIPRIGDDPARDLFLKEAPQQIEAPTL